MKILGQLQTRDTKQCQKAKYIMKVDLDIQTINMLFINFRVIFIGVMNSKISHSDIFIEKNYVLNDIFQVSEWLNLIFIMGL